MTDPERSFNPRTDPVVRLHTVPGVRDDPERYRAVVASLDLAYALLHVVYSTEGAPVDYVVVEHNDAFVRHLGVSGPGRLASELTPGLDQAWIDTFARVAETGESVRFERYEPTLDVWFDVFAGRMGEPSDRLVSLIFRNVTAAHRNQEALRVGRERQAFLLRLMDALRPLEDPLEVQAAATRLLAEHLGADRVFYAVIEPDGETVAIRADYHAGRRPVAGTSFPIGLFGPDLLARMEEGRTIVVADLAAWPVPSAYAARRRSFGTGAAIGVPLVKDGRWVAMLSVHAPGVRDWSPDEIELVEETAERTWSSVERAASAAALVMARRHLDEERERTLAQERAARRQAEAATRMRDEFLASVSHELRTPLAAILLWSRLLASGRVPGREREALAIIESNAEAQRLLVDDLLDASRSMAGTLSVDVQRQALGPVVEEAARAMRPVAEAKDIRLDIVTEPVEVVVDGARIAQVVRNLLDNAIRHTPSGGSISVSVVRRGRHAELVVLDTGSGIAPDLLPHVFDRFRRGSPLDGGAGALGLGLSISREIVRLHHGTIAARSDGPGVGSAFSVRIPVAPRTPGTAVRKARVHRIP